MQQQYSLRVLPSEADDERVIKQLIAGSAGKKSDDVTGYHLVKRSIDARSKQVYINLTVKAFINEPFISRTILRAIYGDVSKARHSVIIIGAGPAGLFAALRCIEDGIKPIILERGKDVRSRRRDLAVLNKEGIINPDSNYCFGEGGAGTYSDGKLYTRSNKRGDINKILNLFVQFGAEEHILYEAHPHIGTNKLPQIITAMRHQILDSGGEFLFNKKVSDLHLKDNVIKSVVTDDGNTFLADAYILATGHSARDIFHLFSAKKILIESKPFALGVRIEHPQNIIDSIQYHCPLSSHRLKGLRPEHLPPASYSLVQQVDGKGVFSFCMCPGGIIAPASTNPNELVVNGWSPSKRNNPFANSGMVVSIDHHDLHESKDFKHYLKYSGLHIYPELSMMYFQEMVEKKAYESGGGKFVAPAQRLVDFCTNIQSSSLPPCSYLPGLNSADIRQVLPSFIYTRLKEGFREFGRKMKGFFTNEAVVVATESRTSSPVRIPRNAETLQHPQISNLYPCGEGAGYAGGIVSAAMDGDKIALQIASLLKKME